MTLFVITLATCDGGLSITKQTIRETWDDAVKAAVEFALEDIGALLFYDPKAESEQLEKLTETLRAEIEQKRCWISDDGETGVFIR